MVAHRWWHKTRFYHDLDDDQTISTGTAENEGKDAAIVQMRAAMQRNDAAVMLMQKGRIGFAISQLGRALGMLRSLSKADANLVRTRKLLFSEISSQPSHGDSCCCTIEISCNDVQNNIFRRAIVASTSKWAANPNSLKAIILFNVGVCRHIQAYGAIGTPKNDALLQLAAKHYRTCAAVEREVPELVRAAAACNLSACVPDSDNVDNFLSLYQGLIDPEDKAAFRECFDQTARAA